MIRYEGEVRPDPVTGALIVAALDSCGAIEAGADGARIVEAAPAVCASSNAALGRPAHPHGY